MIGAARDQGERVGYAWPPGCSAAWLARLLWEQEAASSNLAIPTSYFECCRRLPARVTISGCLLMSLGVDQRLHALAPTCASG
jgi:hypothetical protein